MVSSPPIRSYIVKGARSIGLPPSCHIFKSFFRYLKRIFQVLVGVGDGEEPSFILRRSEINPSPEHLLEEAGKPISVCFLGTVVVGDGLIGEVQGECATFSIDLYRDSRLLSTGV